MIGPRFATAIVVTPMIVRVPGLAVLAQTPDGAELIAWFRDSRNGIEWASDCAASLDCPLIRRPSDHAEAPR